MMVHNRLDVPSCGTLFSSSSWAQWRGNGERWCCRRCACSRRRARRAWRCRTRTRRRGCTSACMRRSTWTRSPSACTRTARGARRWCPASRASCAPAACSTATCSTWALLMGPCCSTSPPPVQRWSFVCINIACCTLKEFYFLFTCCRCRAIIVDFEKILNYTSKWGILLRNLAFK